MKYPMRKIDDKVHELSPPTWAHLAPIVNMELIIVIVDF